METMTLETLCAWVQGDECADTPTSTLVAAIEAALRERDALRSKSRESFHLLKESEVRVAHLMDRAEKAEAELASCKAVNTRLESDLADLRCDKLNNEAMRAEANERADAAGERADSAEAKANSWMNQAWRFESELNALKKRPETEPQRVPIDCIVHVTVSESWRGKRVRLVQVEGDDV